MVEQNFKAFFYSLKGDALRNLLLARYFDQYPWSKKEAAELRAKQPSNAGPGGKERVETLTRNNLHMLLTCNFNKHNVMQYYP